MASRRGRSAATGFMRDFQAFIVKGNVVDLAVAVIIGGAFGKIVESLIKDIITPAILSPVLTSLNVNDLEKLVTAGGIKYGIFLAAVLNFIVIAFVIFLMIRSLEKLKRQEVAEEVAAPPDPAVEAQERLNSTLDRLARSLENRGG